ncbi:DUF4190 domain-containing protein [Terrilactibacillus sp. BCM23-1]|uniref:DUF4190 domain-containing protein n=1 Tax=Terrilactibacillus tamarindi TaxID=2599694 RepID=A0A6N8CMS9_9BACI|nr:DUF4190 domain-containing protein [Terrilactibacillus tamarindi]MTT30840.1 DUF4190 domain-containing protein [Terrilactibacillus tamarindi]
MKSHYYAIASLTLGILSVFIPILGLILAVLGLIFTYSSIKVAKETKQPLSGLSIAGFICSLVGLVLQSFIAFMMVSSYI